MTAMCEYAVHSVNGVRKLRPDFLRKYYKVLQRYVDTKERYELQCLFALQSLINKWEHPPGLLLAIFERLWEDGYISNESLVAWAGNNDPMEQEGKGKFLFTFLFIFPINFVTVHLFTLSFQITVSYILTQIFA